MHRPTPYLRLYLALSDEIDESGEVIAAGINCLNESATSTTTPCLAFDLLFEKRGLMWGREADLPSMLTEILVHQALQVPVMMTALYPFPLGQAALKHEGIPSFPDVEKPENHILVAHCGYSGEVPQSCASEWACRPRVLGIINPNAHAIDARLPEGPTTLVKIASDMQTLAVTPAVLTGYVQYENSDCRNGGVLRVEDGFRFVEPLPSHHTILATGDLSRRVEVMASVMDLTVERIGQSERPIYDRPRWKRTPPPGSGMHAPRRNKRLTQGDGSNWGSLTSQRAGVVVSRGEEVVSRYRSVKGEGPVL